MPFTDKIKWNKHRRGGVIPPSSTIPFTKKCGLIFLRKKVLRQFRGRELFAMKLPGVTFSSLLMAYLDYRKNAFG